MTLLLNAKTAPIAPELESGTPVRLAPAAPALWRVIDTAGHIIGHLQALTVDAGVRYRARRFRAGAHAFLDLGEFWSADDAIECLRHSR